MDKTKLFWLFGVPKAVVSMLQEDYFTCVTFSVSVNFLCLITFPAVLITLALEIL